MVYPDLVLDLIEFQRVLKEQLAVKIKSTEPLAHWDVLTRTARIVSGHEDLDLSIAQRSELKSAMHGTLYGIDAETFMKNLQQRNKEKS